MAGIPQIPELILLPLLNWPSIPAYDKKKKAVAVHKERQQ